MEKRVCIFVDGENFRKTIVELFLDEFNKEEYLPKKANWTKFFDWIAREAFKPTESKEYERIRTYWYVIQHVDFYPYKLPRAEVEPAILRKLLCEHDEYRKEIERLGDSEQIIKINKIRAQLEKRLSMMQKRSEGWIRMQDWISKEHNAIEFRRAGAIRYNLLSCDFGPEKAVDVKLATDMIILRDIYDIAVIVSGDQDYVPAVKVVKDSGKRVVNVSFSTRGGKLLPGGAWRLNSITDWTFTVPYNDLKTYLNI